MTDPTREIVVTGYGVCCNLGDDANDVEAALRAGRHPPFQRWETAVEYNCRCQLVGLYPGDLSDGALGLDKAEGRFMGRSSRLALRAARQAVARAGLNGPEARDLAVVVGSGTGDVDAIIEVRRKLDETKNARKVLPTMVPRLMASTVSANLVNVLRTTGPSFCATAACAGGAYNLLLAAELLRSGHCTRALAGGAEVIDIHFHAGFDSMRAYNGGDNDHPERASRPYAADRAGFIFAEGAGLLVLETRAGAAARGAEVLGVLRGWGMSSDGEGQMVAPSSDGAYRAMVAALRHASVAPGDVDYVNTHGTSTPLGDVGEVKAIRRAFDGRPVAYSSTKGSTGHTVSAAGALEAAFTLAMLRGGWVAPSVNARPLDPALADYAPVMDPLDRPLRLALSNSFGFGGTNVTLVLGPP
ncbi:MAG TPA: beta-ketoacyl-[acyl-carrier-protein] synthase family protein [Myxococcota bacterium]|jgi:3-oxoacyl-[acyl-carrier-protein] synthase-1|nr:beta-ketoacyl-[acyl-carrier-protein] synthase family protein [Myxococcota bacterium]